MSSKMIDLLQLPYLIEAKCQPVAESLAILCKHAIDRTVKGTLDVAHALEGEVDLYDRCCAALFGDPDGKFWAYKRDNPEDYQKNYQQLNSVLRRLFHHHAYLKKSFKNICMFDDRNQVDRLRQSQRMLWRLLLAMHGDGCNAHVLIGNGLLKWFGGDDVLQRELDEWFASERYEWHFTTHWITQERRGFSEDFDGLAEHVEWDEYAQSALLNDSSGESES